MSHVILYAIVPIIVVMLAGFFSGKAGIFNGDDSKKFNKVVLDYALPAALFISIVQSSREMLAADVKLTIVSLIAIMGCFMAVYFVFRLFKGNTGADAAVSALISGSPTIGFLGFAVLEPIFGTTPAVALVVAIVGIVVNAVGIPVGLSLMNASLEKQKPGSTKGDSAWKPVIHALEQPVAWAPILAVVWVLVGIPWPKWASPSFDLIKGANASLAVFSAGITLSAVKVQINLQAIVGSVMKMVLMPAVALVLGLLFGMEVMNLKMLVVACALPPAFSGIIIADEYDTYVATGTTSLTLSVILFVAFCPLWLWICDLVTHTTGF
ncbi:MAG: AEC family transporter [Duncaniella sp.]|nr:AEC family transporter [Duncaniella sp.]MDE6466103.1 AEC family transporter [Duncaniella sp.]MDE6573351.1 AEC family transporter [Duncaniella sp.]